MKAGVAFAVAACVVACGVYTHRNVIKAVVKGEPMPKAPSWHFWVRKEDRVDG